jgi:hypothetical protein
MAGWFPVELGENVWGTCEPMKPCPPICWACFALAIAIIIIIGLDIEFCDDPNIGFCEDPNIGFCEDPNIGFCEDPNIGFCEEPNIGFCEDPSIGFCDDIGFCDPNIGLCDCWSNSGSKSNWRIDCKFVFEPDWLG